MEKDIAATLVLLKVSGIAQKKSRARFLLVIFILIIISKLMWIVA